MCVRVYHKVHTRPHTIYAHTIHTCPHTIYVHKCTLLHVLFFELRSVIAEMTHRKSDLHVLCVSLSFCLSESGLGLTPQWTASCTLLCPLALTELLMSSDVTCWPPRLRLATSPHHYFVYVSLKRFVALTSTRR